MGHLMEWSGIYLAIYLSIDRSFNSPTLWLENSVVGGVYIYTYIYIEETSPREELVYRLLCFALPCFALFIWI